MFAGMGTVFVFLTSLVLAMNLMSRLLARLPTAPPPPVRTGADTEEVAAIAAAIRKHRGRSPNR